MTAHVVIVGGGLSGLAAAAALAGRDKLRVTLLESRPRWGGRASSFVDQATGQKIDNCQHVNLGCGTNFQHFCRTVGIDSLFHREERLTFIGPDGSESAMSACPLPAPLHLLPSLARLRYLSWTEKRQLARGLQRLARLDPARCCEESFLEWLKRDGQSPAVIDRFWHVVLVSALSETLDRIDIGHARKVFVDAFLANRRGWKVWLPTVPLDALYGTKLEDWFAARNVICRLQTGVQRVVAQSRGNANGGESFAQNVIRAAKGVELRSGERVQADHVLIAVPQHLLLALLPEEWRSLPEWSGIGQMQTAPISSVHLWFDRPITDLRHAVLVGRVSQWLFNRSAIHTEEAANSYYQVVISASRDVLAQGQEKTIRKVLDELAAVWPAVHRATLVHSRLVTEHKAVVSMLPGIDRLRPPQQSPIANLQIAGDWTQTGWPGTMEGAVRSGYLAAENILRHIGLPQKLVQPDLPRALLSKLLFGL